ncbi:serine/threonine-protein kinase [Actinomycetospora sp. C-140]
MSTPTSVPSASATIEPGRLVAGRYLLLAPVGRGGSGSVWRAHDELLDRDVAIKRLHGGRALDADRARQVRERAHREGRVAARLHHPRLAAIFDMTELDGEVCLVMEYVAAPSLGDLLEREGSLPPARVAAIGAQIAEGLAAMHERGIVHRDVKPANIMIGAGDTVTVADFGIAVVDADPGTADQLVAGTPHYMAPELARGGPATAAADVFSLGATLYAAMEGTPPAGDGGNALEVLSRVATGVVQPSRHAGELTPVLRALLAHDPASRPDAARAARLLRGDAPASISSATGTGATAIVSGDPATDVGVPPSTAPADGSDGPDGDALTGPIAVPAGAAALAVTRAETPVGTRSARRKRSERLRPARRAVAAGAGLVGVLGAAGGLVAANTSDPVPVAAAPDAAGSALPAPLPVPVAAPPVIPAGPTTTTTTARRTAVEDVDEVASTSEPTTRRSRDRDAERVAAAWERWFEQYRDAQARSDRGHGDAGNGHGHGRGQGRGHGGR